MDQPLAPDAIVLWANHHQFSARSRLRFTMVQSRMLLWGISGNGSVTVNGVELPLAPDEFVVMPWKHSVSYNPASKDPFYVGGVHIVPKLPMGLPVVYRVWHVLEHESVGAAPAEFANREDEAIPGFGATVVRGRFEEAPALRHLAEYTVEWFQRFDAGEFAARTLARLLVAELVRFAAGVKTAAPTPLALTRMMAFARDRLGERVSLADLARAGECSPATASRLFLKHAGLPPGQWLSRQRMDRAARLLATTNLRLGEVGQRVGVSDPHYFSKLFRACFGVSAKEYRQRTALV